MGKMLEAETITPPESIEAFFQSLELPDIYGKRRDKQNDVKVVEITQEQYERWISSRGSAEEIAFAKSHGMRDISWLNGKRLDNGERKFYIEESPLEQQLTYWAPHQIERRAILSLAKALNPSAVRPVILDVGAYNYFLTHLLAYDNEAMVVGLDRYAAALSDHRIKVPSRSAHLIQGDLWELLYILGPKFNANDQQKRRELLEKIRDAQRDEEIFHNFADYGNFQFGNPMLLNEEVEELQRIAATGLCDSQVDIAICSIMTRNADLTVPLRDGVFPKAIVYVRLFDGLAGAGDFYFDKHETILETEDDFLDADKATAKGIKINEDSVISHNPGRNYRLFARWPTYWKGDWDVFNYGLRDMEAEVIIQVRNDIVLGKLPEVIVTKLPFDIEIEKESTRSSWKVGNWDKFSETVNAVLTNSAAQ